MPASPICTADTALAGLQSALSHCPLVHLRTELRLRPLLSKFLPPAYNPALPLAPQATHVLQKPLLGLRGLTLPFPWLTCLLLHCLPRPVAVTSAGECPLFSLPEMTLLLFIAMLPLPFLFLEQTLTYR